MKINYLIPFLSLLLIAIQACDPGMVYDQFQKTEDNEWSWDEKKVFEVEMDQPDEYYNIYINVRHTKEYPKSNLYVFLTIDGPNDAQSHDTIDIAIANASGKWVGKGFGDIKFVRKQIREKVRFAFPGKYIFTMEQGMRLEEVPVTDVGLRIEEYSSIK